MERKIKFRGWNGHSMEYGDDFAITFGGDFLCEDSDAHGSGVTAHVQMNNPRYFNAVMQFTGLKDKNGKEIYEGDIIYSSHVEDEKAGPVEWSNIHHAYIINYPKRKGDGMDQWQDMHGKEHCYEVIGNIYENKELLK